MNTLVGEVIGMCKFALARGLQIDIQEISTVLEIPKREFWSVISGIESSPEDVDCLKAIVDYVPREERKRLSNERRDRKRIVYEVMSS